MREKRKRPFTADAQLNREEHAWWDAHALQVARFWEMDSSISTILRRRYLAKIRSFFTKGRSEVEVLELGCGSGWVGQAIAGGGVRIIGTDFSESQLALARENADNAALADFVSYRLGAANEWPHEVKTCNAVLIHSFLHHLDDVEIREFLSDLSRLTSPGTRIAIFEPAFGNEAASGKPSRLTKAAHALSSRLVSKINADIRAQGLSDEGARHAFVSLFNDANEKGWYLSPKEVPFHVNEFTSQLKGHFEVLDQSWAVVDLIGWAFERNLMQERPLKEHWLWPSVAFLDSIVAKDEAYLGLRLTPPAHAFHLWFLQTR